MHCRVGKEAAIVLREGVVRFPDPVPIPICPPYCSLLVHTLILLCLSHALDCLHLSPNHLSLILPLLHLYQSQGSMGNWALVWCFASASLAEAWDLAEKGAQALRPLCWMAGNSCGGGHRPACLHYASLSRPSVSSPLEGYVGLWTRH